MRFTKDMLNRICEQLLGVATWRPKIDPDDMDAVLEVLALCGSHLERMYALGALFRLGWLSLGDLQLLPAVTTIADVPRRGLWFVDPWNGFYCPRCQERAGPSGVILVPQMSLRGKVWDFGIVLTNDNGAQDGTLFGVAEIDGYSVHRSRRKRDAHWREDLATAGLPVFACYEERHSPAKWFDAVIHRYWQVGGHSEAELCYGARGCEVFLPTTSEAA